MLAPKDTQVLSSLMSSSLLRGDNSDCSQHRGGAAGGGVAAPRSTRTGGCSVEGVGRDLPAAGGGHQSHHCECSDRPGVRISFCAAPPVGRAQCCCGVGEMTDSLGVGRRRTAPPCPPHHRKWSASNALDTASEPPSTIDIRCGVEEGGPPTAVPSVQRATIGGGHAPPLAIFHASHH